MTATERALNLLKDDVPAEWRTIIRDLLADLKAAEKPRANADRSQVRQERESRLDDLAKCSGGHDTRHYYGWLDDISDLERENAALAEQVKELKAERDCKSGSVTCDLHLAHGYPCYRHLYESQPTLKTTLSGKTFDDAEYQRGRTEAASEAADIVEEMMMFEGGKQESYKYNSVWEAATAIRDHFKTPAV